MWGLFSQNGKDTQTKFTLNDSFTPLDKQDQHLDNLRFDSLAMANELELIENPSRNDPQTRTMFQFAGATTLMAAATVAVVPRVTTVSTQSVMIWAGLFAGLNVLMTALASQDMNKHSDERLKEIKGIAQDYRQISDHYKIMVHDKSSRDAHSENILQIERKDCSSTRQWVRHIVWPRSEARTLAHQEQEKQGIYWATAEKRTYIKKNHD